MENINRKLIAFVIGLIVGGGVFWTVSTQIMKEKINPSLYYAVFINNGQVYFGNLKDKSDTEFTMVGVYYLQTESTEQIGNEPQKKFSLKKLGTELHGPTDVMYINRQNVLFYEELRPDSEVVKSIMKSETK